MTPLDMMAGSFSGSSLLVALSMVLGICVVALIALAFSIASHRKASAVARAARHSVTTLRGELDRAEALVETSGDGLIELGVDGARSVVFCPSDQNALPDTPARLARFEDWVEPADATVLEDAIAELLTGGKGFSCDVRTLSGSLANVEGRPIGARLLLRVRDLSRLQRDFAEALHMSASLELESQRLKQLLNALDFPIWTGDGQGLVSWSNDAFKARHASGAGSAENAIATARSVLGTGAQWEAITAGHDQGKAVMVAAPPAGGAASADAGDEGGDQLVHLKLAGDAGRVLTAGFARPMAAEAKLEAALEQMRGTQAQILNAMSTAVCVFTADRHVSFYNDAFAQLFGFQRRVLDERPHESTVLTYIKSTRQMPESGDHRGWRTPFAAAYTAKAPVTDDWELHDGRYLRVIMAPNGDGGAIWLFENETEKQDLIGRFAAESKARKASLEALREGVAVFGSDGCLQLANPAFGALWGLAAEEMSIGTHIKQVTAPIRDLARERATVDQIVAMVGSLGYHRQEMQARLDLTDDRVIDLVSTPLPGGATMLTVDDVSASIAIEDTLRESNAALEEAARIKTAFIKHVSYELRSPLTPIVGFTELLLTPETGHLNERQSEYLGYVKASTNTLKVLVDSVLDLATVDAGMLALSIDRVPPDALIDEAMAGLEERASDARMTIERRLDPHAPFVTGDRVRMRQVLYNLLSNAISFSRPGNAVRVRTTARNGQVELSVIDHGRGMTPEQMEAAFEPFETGANRQGTGAGLGLTLARALVELHGGTIKLWSREGLGTVVRCTFPGPNAVGRDVRDAAE
ncbi:MAG: PAS-domain containing protein [Devosiaceae bacterium]|nr:PAS-domain containing protein [Devosiaceae bacterium MH13]